MFSSSISQRWRPSPYLTHQRLHNEQRVGRLNLSVAFGPVGAQKKLTVKRRSAPEPGKKPERPTFLSLEEAGLVEVSGLSTHERFLCRLTISSLNLLRVVAEQENCKIEELNAGKLCDWFVKDKMKREQNIDSAVLQWDDSEFVL